MKILVTGSSGTIGTRLCEILLERGFEVVGADWEPNKWNKTIDDITVKVDLRDEGVFEQLPTDVHIVVHLAANARVYELVEHPDRARDNVLTLWNTLEWCRKNNISKFIFASSRETYGNINKEILTEKDAHFMHCESPYTASKIAGEAFVESYKRCYQMDTINFRFSNVYGMYDDSVRVVPLFIRLAKQNEPMTVFGKEKCLDFTYIDDTVEGIILAIEQFDQAKNDTYNLAYGEGTTILHLAERVKELMNSESEIVTGEPRTGEVIKYVADISKAKAKLGYEPKTPFDEGIEKSVEWYAANT